MNRILRAAMFLAFVLGATSAWAGQNCTPRQPQPADARAALSLAHKVDRHLESSGARAALIGRVGRDLSEYGLRYSHLGLALRDEARGRWRVVHLLNHCGRADSELYDEGLGNFFLDDLFQYEAVVLIPSPEWQERLASGVAAGQARALHQAAYSLIAHPYSAKYQNSNQWLLELMAATGGEASRGAAQARLAREGYEPGVIPLPPGKRLGARLFSVNTRFDDHSMAEWSSSRYQVVTAESVLAWAQRIAAPVRQSVLTLP